MVPQNSLCEMKGLIAAFNYTQVNFDESEYCSNIYKHSDHISRTPVMKPLPTLLVQGCFFYFVWIKI